MFKKKDRLNLKNTIKSIYESIEIITVLDNCETLRKRESNYGKLTRAKENTGEPPVLRRQERLLVVTGFLVPLRVTRSGSVFSLILLTFRNIHNVKLSFANAT